MRSTRILSRSISIVAIALPAALFVGCQDDEPTWPEREMDARSFPKESPSADLYESGCGNGVLDFDEACEPEGWPTDVQCRAPYTGGQLQCAPDCTLNLEDCDGGSCRNGIVEGGEECDTSAYLISVQCRQGEECSACTLDCQVVDSSSCGNGVVELPDEECDGDVFVEAVQRTVGVVELSRYDSTTVTCSPDCQVVLSEASPAECWNGILEAGENCERDDGETYTTPDGQRGYCISCNLEVVPGSCGDGILQPDFEQCDGATFPPNRATCEDWLGTRYSPDDPVQCTNTCEVDRDNCELRETDTGIDAGGDEPESTNGCSTSSGQSTHTPGFWFIAALFSAGFAGRRRIGHPLLT